MQLVRIDKQPSSSCAVGVHHMNPPFDAWWTIPKRVEEIQHLHRANMCSDANRTPTFSLVLEIPDGVTRFQTNRLALASEIGHACTDREIHSLESPDQMLVVDDEPAAPKLNVDGR